MKRQKISIYFFNIFTLIVWLWLIFEFITKSQISLPTIFTSLYLIFLTFYASDKEIRRWRQKLENKRRGEIFVYLWLLTLIIIVAFYIFGGQEQGYMIPRELPTITGSVLVIYIITDYLKEEFTKRK